MARRDAHSSRAGSLTLCPGAQEVLVKLLTAVPGPSRGRSPSPGTERPVEHPVPKLAPPERGPAAPVVEQVALPDKVELAGVKKAGKLSQDVAEYDALPLCPNPAM